jgi:hypothetical protein
MRKLGTMEQQEELKRFGGHTRRQLPTLGKRKDGTKMCKL